MLKETPHLNDAMLYRMVDDIFPKFCRLMLKIVLALLRYGSQKFDHLSWRGVCSESTDNAEAAMEAKNARARA